MDVLKQRIVVVTWQWHDEYVRRVHTLANQRIALTDDEVEEFDQGLDTVRGPQSTLIRALERFRADAATARTPSPPTCSASRSTHV